MPAQADVNRFVIDYLRHGPAEMETLYLAAFKWGRAPRGWSTAPLCTSRSGDWLGPMILVRPDDDVKFVAIPKNLAAIWWARKGQPQLWGLQNSRGNAA